MKMCLFTSNRPSWIDHLSLNALIGVRAASSKTEYMNFGTNFSLM